MADNIALSTIGVRVGYFVETEEITDKSTLKSKTFTRIHGLYSTPDFNVAPNTADVTSFDNETYTSKIALLREIPDNIEFGARFGQGFATEWETLCSAYDTAATSNKQVWFCISIKGYTKAIYFKGKPLDLGLPAMEANSGIDISVYISPESEPAYADAPTTEIA